MENNSIYKTLSGEHIMLSSIVRIGEVGYEVAAPYAFFEVDCMLVDKPLMFRFWRTNDSKNLVASKEDVINLANKCRDDLFDAWSDWELKSTRDLVCGNCPQRFFDQQRIVSERLTYHFANVDGSWNIPDGMPFMNEFLNEVRKLCDITFK